MKFNPITSAIAIGLSALIAYGFYSFNDNSLKVVLSAGSFIFLGLTLLFSIGAGSGSFARNLNTRTASWFFFFLALASHLLFSFVTFTVPAYVVTHGIMFLLYLLVLYYIIRPLPKV